MKKRPSKQVFIILGVLASLFALVMFTLEFYVAYVLLSYKRVGTREIEVNQRSAIAINLNDIGTKEFTITTFNIGFGAYSRPYSFFMDEGEYKEEFISVNKSKTTKGIYAKGLSKEDTIKNTKGAFEMIKKQVNEENNPLVDFALYQEVDIRSHRAYKINQFEEAILTHPSYSYTRAINYDSAYLAYPFNDPIGASKSAVATFSRYKIESAKREELPISTGFSKLFDLDRCYSKHEFKIEGSSKKLFIYNVHLSAYDATGEIRSGQMKKLKADIKDTLDWNGVQNYVVVGGDFNHDLVVDNPLYDINTIPWWDNYEIDGTKASWYNYFRLGGNLSADGEKDFVVEDHIKAFTGVNIPTCRDASVPYGDLNNNGILDNFVVSIDGFLVSDNIEVIETVTIGSGGHNEVEEPLESSAPGAGFGFIYSDHNPVKMRFKLT
ncbi:MAG: hypothetical protein QM205_05250 [Bacillota bacterium]|nr:hypothetical protein [Bacillota bacterium]